MSEAAPVAEDQVAIPSQPTGNDEATAAAAAFATARGDEPAAPVETPADSQNQDDGQDTSEPEPKLFAGKTEAEIAELLSEIPSMREGYRKQIDNLAGNYGKLNAMLQRLQQETPNGVAVEVTDEDLGDMTKEFPELAGMQKAALNNVLKKLNVRGVSHEPGINDERVNELVSERVSKERVAIHIDLLDGLHPDWAEVTGIDRDKGTINQDCDYRKWLNSQSAEYQQKVLNSNNAFEIGKSIEAFKKEQEVASKKREQNKQRLAANVQPSGQPSAARTALSEQQAADRAFQARRQR